jgi:hemolysin D
MGAIQTSRPPSLASDKGQATSEVLQLKAAWADVNAKLDKLDAERTRRLAEVATVRELIAELDATIPLAEQREADYKGLAEQGFMSGLAGQDRTRERIELERDWATQPARLAETQAALREVEGSRAAYLAETQQLLGERQAQAVLKHQQLTQERHKTDQRSRLTQLTAPVAGTVQQVAVHTQAVSSRRRRC